MSRLGRASSRDPLAEREGYIEEVAYGPPLNVVADCSLPPLLLAID